MGMFCCERLKATLDVGGEFYIDLVVWVGERAHSSYESSGAQCRHNFYILNVIPTLYLGKKQYLLFLLIFSYMTYLGELYC